MCAYAIFVRRDNHEKTKSQKHSPPISKGAEILATGAKGEAAARKQANAKAAGTNPQRVRAILEKLDEAYPNVTCALEHQNAFQLLIATILSAQCTDERVNQRHQGRFS